MNVQFEARLALAELTLKFGEASEGRMQLNALEKDATEKSFSAFARKAAAIRNSS
jgi:hypothetical protein